MKFFNVALLASTVAAFSPSSNSRAATKTCLSETISDLKVLANELNPVVSFYDPLGLSQKKFWGGSEEATIGFLREAEIKHGRIAMFAFVGFIVHANGIHFPWSMTMDGEPFPQVSSAPEAWDAIPEGAKIQILLFVGFLEFWNETQNRHYMRGGRPGDFPDFNSEIIPGGALNLYDPFGWSSKRSDADKASGLLKEINNGRLAMIGIMGFVSEAKVPGSVPLLTGIIPKYDGEIMAPFAKSILPSLPATLYQV